MSDAQQAQAEILALSVTVLKARATVVESLARIRARHSQFDDMICGGAKLVTLLGQLSTVAVEFNTRERRERLELGDIETAVLRPTRFGYCD